MPSGGLPHLYQASVAVRIAVWFSPPSREKAVLPLLAFGKAKLGDIWTACELSGLLMDVNPLVARRPRPRLERDALLGSLGL